MNNVYTHDYKEVEVMDDKGNIRKVDYSDNIGEILECENVVAKLEEDIISKNNYLRDNRKYGTSNKLKLYMPTILSLLGFLASIISIKLSMYPSSKALIAIEMIVGTFGSISTLSFSIASFIHRYSSARFYKAVEAKVYGLEKMLEKEKSKLEELNKNKTITKNKNDDNKMHRVSDDKIHSIDNFISLLGVFGCSKRQYLKMYNSGEMDQVLLDNYDSEKTEIVHSYFEDNAKVLSKKKDRKI